MYSPTECMVHMWIILLLFSFGKICKNTLFYFRKSRYFLYAEALLALGPRLLMKMFKELYA